PEVEEVVVTGSFIRRTEGFRAASPVTQLSAEDLATEGTPNMGDVINNLSFNNGSTVTQNSFTGASSGSTSINLRGLGSGATLNLVDGIRVIGTNVNRFLPQIAIQRLDIVTDGAAALYGNQAVAGVVNFVPRTSYDGVKVELYRQGDSRGDYRDTTISFLAGTEWNGVSVVAAADWRTNNNLKMIDRPDQMNAGLTSSSTPNPGRYAVPTRDANGVLTGSTATRSDPNCGGTRQDPTQPRNNVTGFTFGGQCWFDFGEFWDYRAAQDQGTAFLSLSYDVSSDITISAQTNYFSTRNYNRGSPSNPGGRTGELPVIRGELPGNPFRAVDANGNELFAQDANNDGIPDRDGNNVVILDPNGIAFNEDVEFSSWRPWGKHGVLPEQLNGDGSTAADSYFRGVRQTFKASFPVPFLEDWQGNAAYAFSVLQNNSRANNFSLGAFTDGLNCDVVNAPETCFNPFVSTSPDTLNDQDLVNSTYTQHRVNNEDRLQTLDIVLNGEILPDSIELPGGTIGAAVGYQYREDRVNETPAYDRLTGDTFIGNQLRPFSAAVDVDAWFAELSLPVHDTLELQLAVRNEKYSTGYDSTDPKYGLVWTPLDFLTLRASMGSSFIAPTLEQRFGQQECGLSNISDPFTPFAAFTASCLEGNAALTPETADTKSFGFELDLIEGMTLSLDYSETDFEDRIITYATNDVLGRDFAAFQAATGFTGPGEPTTAQVEAWVADPRSDKNIQRDPNNVNQIDRIIRTTANATGMLVQAYDMKFRYFIPTDSLGMFNVALDASYLKTYEYQLDASSPVVEGAGFQNGITGAVPPLPEYKANLSLGWSMDQHSANVTVRYIDDIVYNDPAATRFAFQRFLPFSNYRTVTELRASTIVDAAYNYSQYEALGGEFTFTVGARNLFDREAQKVPQLGGVESFLQDPTGRMVYARITYEM
ncbi:MAG: TonB-dependent receptor, partial [Pseudohongiellaceae bacterium]|nr:TonB-dependent receptor [Pseudohongiellaceae bacterium]